MNPSSSDSECNSQHYDDNNNSNAELEAESSTSNTSPHLNPNPNSYESTIYSQFSTYPFEQDQMFMQGLESVLSTTAPTQAGSNDPEEHYAGIIGRAKAFYFSRITGQTVTWEGYLLYENNNKNNLKFDSEIGSSNMRMELDTGGLIEQITTMSSQSQSHQQEQHNEQDRDEYPSITAITRLLQEGREDLIPNNEKIPDGLNEAAPSESLSPPKKKPWEINNNPILSSVTESTG